MTENNYLKNLTVPEGRADVVIDTDTYNEIDDQFAIAYLLRSKEKLNTVALYAAPFFNDKSSGPADGMEKSYNEIMRILDLCGEPSLKTSVYRGSATYLADENTAVISDAANDLVRRASDYSPENPLYVVAIGAITNIASALLIKPEIAENIVIVWLGGHAHHWRDTNEFNMRQDIAASRVVMSGKAPFVQLPCMGVVSAFGMSGAELDCWFKGQNSLCDYLAEIMTSEGKKYAVGPIWGRIIWDVTAVAWLLNDNERFMDSKITSVRLSDYECNYENEIGKKMCYVYNIKRERLMNDLVKKLTERQ